MFKITTYEDIAILQFLINQNLIELAISIKLTVK